MKLSKDPKDIKEAQDTNLAVVKEKVGKNLELEGSKYKITYDIHTMNARPAQERLFKSLLLI